MGLVYASTEKNTFDELDAISISSEIVELEPEETFNQNLKEVQASQIVTSDSKLEVNPPKELQLSADLQSYDSRKKRFVAKGNVKAFLNGALLKADHIEFDKGFKTLYARGKVRFRKGTQYFQATSFRYSLAKKIGELEDVYGVLDLQYLGKDLKEIFKSSSAINRGRSLNGEPNSKGINRQNTEFSKNIQVDFNRENITAVSLGGNSFFNLSNSPDTSKTVSNKAIDTHLVDETIACPASLPPIPDWHPQPWAVTTWGGQMTDAKFGEAFLFDGDLREEYLFGVGLQKRVYRSGPFSLEFEADLFDHLANKQSGGKYNQSVPYADTPAQNFGEAIIGIGARLWLNPWLNFGFVEGISVHSSVSNFEKTYRDKYSQLLNYLGFEIEARLSEKYSLVGRVHHRSGVFGTYAGAREGSNAYLIGLRYRFGIEPKKQSLVNFPIPYGCRGSEKMIRKIPLALDDSLDTNSLEDFNPFSQRKVVKQKTNDYLKNDLFYTNLSYLTPAEQESLREKSIELVNQRIYNLRFKDSFAIQGRLGIQTLSKNVNQGNSDTGVRVAQLDGQQRAKLITGSITRWRIQASKIRLNPNGWSTSGMSFTNDPFTPTQTRIDSVDVNAIEQGNGDLLIKTRKSRLVIEERLAIPIPNERRIKNKSEEIKSRWVFGIDLRDRDGLFIGRQVKTIKIGSEFSLSLQPQFLIQRAAIDKTNSYISNGSSVTSDKVSSSINFSDLFGMRAKLRGQVQDWDVRLDSNISTFNLDRFANGSRYWGSLKKPFKAPLINSAEATIFGAYRYKTWNGSIGETDIYTAYGSYVEKKDEWEWGKVSNKYTLRFGAGNYQAEKRGGGDLAHLWRANLYSSVDSEYPILQGKAAKLTPSHAYRYSPVPIIPGLKLKSKLSTSYFAYEDGKNQSTLSLSGGPELTLGKFINPYLDYTKLSVTLGGTLKQGGSPFEFDDAVDLATLGVGLTQQIAGPLVLNSGIEYNIDGGSKYYGKEINSRFELRWQKRTYDLALFYSPHKGVGGLTIRLHDFSFDGTGIPFVQSDSLNKKPFIR